MNALFTFMAVDSGAETSKQSEVRMSDENGFLVSWDDRVEVVSGTFAGAIVLLGISVTTLFGNSLLVFAIRSDKRLHSVTNNLVVCLGTTDFTLALLNVSVLLPLVVEGVYPSQAMCLAQGAWIHM